MFVPKLGYAKSNLFKNKTDIYCNGNMDKKEYLELKRKLENKKDLK